MNNKTATKISYEPEADVLTYELTNQPIDYAKEIGNVVVHFTKDNTPVLVELLEARSFFSDAKKLLQQKQRAAMQ